MALTLPLPLIHAHNRGRAILAGYLIFCACYLGASSATLASARLLEPSWLDRLIPFLPASIWVYLSQFGLLFYALWATPDNLLRTRTYYAALLATMMACAVFLLIPLKVARQPLQGEGLTALAWQGLYLSDTPANCFPSLHVALATLAAVTLRRRGGPWRWLAPLWVGAIALSTLTTKQHYAIDLLAGLVLSPLAFALAKAVLPWPRYACAR
jgi:membrane-associated phospholipid phosphatase